MCPRLKKERITKLDNVSTLISKNSTHKRETHFLNLIVFEFEMKRRGFAFS